MNIITGIWHLKKQKKIRIENKGIRAVFSYEGGVSAEEFTHVESGFPMNEGHDLLQITIRGSILSSKDFQVTNVALAGDRKMELVTFTMEQQEEGLRVRLHLINDREASITVLWQIWDEYRTGVPCVSRLHVPFLANFDLGKWDANHYYPSSVMRCRDGRDVIKRPGESFYGSDIRLPLVLTDQEEMNGFSISFAGLSDLSDEGSTQNISHLLWKYVDNELHLRDHNILINPDPSFNDTLELNIRALTGGWPEAFNLARREWRENYDFSQYKREDLAWIRDCPVNHFAFLFGSEAYDYKNQRIDTARFLRDGMEFGGYDTVTIWNQYPRLGVDSRTQWEFYDDFPGGRDAIREMVEECHQKGVKVLLPYIPWDRAEDESTASMGDEFARIVKDTGADGYQLDTCKELPLSYREKLDAVRPGLLLQTQAHPYKKLPMELITSSWDEFWYSNPMPEVDLLRFMLPEHVAPMISRWLREEDKTLLIKRCMFGAAPIVIWQDVFGRAMPFSKEQKATIKAWKQAYLSYQDIYLGDEPIPLYPVSEKDVYCNLFRSRGGKRAIFSFYNDGEREKEFSFRQRALIPKAAAFLLGEGRAWMETGEIRICIPAEAVMHVMVEGDSGGLIP